MARCAMNVADQGILIALPADSPPDGAEVIAR
jgi:hypothetical protein